MKQIPLTKRGYYALVDDEDYDTLSKYKWYYRKHKFNHTAYTATRLKGSKKLIYMHQLLITVPPNQHIDHKDRNGLNNQKSNLRPATPSQNHFNQRKAKGKTSIYKGVSFSNHNKKWRVQIMLNNQKLNIGLFTNEGHAGMAYDLWASYLFGEFAKTNFSINSTGF